MKKIVIALSLLSLVTSCKKSECQPKEVEVIKEVKITDTIEKIVIQYDTTYQISTKALFGNWTCYKRIFTYGSNVANNSPYWTFEFTPNLLSGFQDKDGQRGPTPITYKTDSIVLQFPTETRSYSFLKSGSDYIMYWSDTASNKTETWYLKK